MSTHLVTNLRARHLHAGAPLTEALRSAAARHACTLHETGSWAELDEAARAIAAAQPATVVLAGGDGSYMAGLTALARAYGDVPLPRIALGPGGTVSTVARNHGFSGDARAFAARLVARAADARSATAAAATLRVIGDAGEGRLGFIFGAGLVARFFEMYEAGGARGYGGAARIVTRIFASSFVGGATAARVLTPSPCALDLDGARAHASAYSLIVASTVKDLGLGMRVTYRAGDDPARVHVVASPLGPRALGPQLPLVLLGKRLRGRDHVDALVRRATFDFGDPAPYILDGDLFHARRLGVHAGPLLALVVG